MKSPMENNPPVANCAYCGAFAAVASNAQQTISFEGMSSLNHELVSVPALKCNACGFVGTSPDAEEMIDKLKQAKRREVLARECVKLREASGVSRTAWLELTRIGDASLTRWETCTKEPNPGYVQFLYLLTFPDNMRRLKEKARRIDQEFILLTNNVDPVVSDLRVFEPDYSLKFPGSSFGEREQSRKKTFELVA